eukprot:211089-Prorocentrum_minimum.AAC.3
MSTARRPSTDRSPLSSGSVSVVVFHWWFCALIADIIDVHSGATLYAGRRQCGRPLAPGRHLRVRIPVTPPPNRQHAPAVCAEDVLLRNLSQPPGSVGGRPPQTANDPCSVPIRRLSCPQMHRLVGAVVVLRMPHSSHAPSRYAAGLHPPRTLRRSTTQAAAPMLIALGASSPYDI